MKKIKNKEQLLKYLNTLSDEKYKHFSKKITPGEFEMLGIRIPDLKRIVKNLSNEERKILQNIDDGNIFEIRMIKALIVANIKNAEEYRKNFEMVLPLINNWAICDTFLSSSKIIKKDRQYFWTRCQQLLNQEDEFLNRVAFVIILNYFIIDEYIDDIFVLINNFQSDKYYANMALAWLISFLYIKYPKQTQKFLLKNNLDRIVIKLSIRKIKDSYRVSKENKEWLKKIS